MGVKRKQYLPIAQGLRERERCHTQKNWPKPTCKCEPSQTAANQVGWNTIGPRQTQPNVCESILPKEKNIKQTLGFKKMTKNMRKYRICQMACTRDHGLKLNNGNLED